MIEFKNTFMTLDLLHRAMTNHDMPLNAQGVNNVRTDLSTIVKRLEAAEAELARRDAIAGELVHLYREHNPCNGMKTDWIEIDSEQLALLKESTDPDTAEFRTLQDAAPPAVLPPEMTFEQALEVCRNIPGAIAKSFQEGANWMRQQCLELGAQPQKPVVPDYFSSLVNRATDAAKKAMVKFPQPNYVLLKVAEEAGEVVQAGVHYAEGRETWDNLEGEVVQTIAMLYRLVTEGDQVNGITPPKIDAANVPYEVKK